MAPKSKPQRSPVSEKPQEKADGKTSSRLSKIQKTAQSRQKITPWNVQTSEAEQIDKGRNIVSLRQMIDQFDLSPTFPQTALATVKDLLNRPIVRHVDARLQQDNKNRIHVEVFCRGLSQQPPASRTFEQLARLERASMDEAVALVKIGLIPIIERLLVPPSELSRSNRWLLNAASYLMLNNDSTQKIRRPCPQLVLEKGTSQAIIKATIGGFSPSEDNHSSYWFFEAKISPAAVEELRIPQIPFYDRIEWTGSRTSGKTGLAEEDIKRIYDSKAYKVAEWLITAFDGYIGDKDEAQRQVDVALLRHIAVSPNAFASAAFQKRGLTTFDAIDKAVPWQIFKQKNGVFRVDSKVPCPGYRVSVRLDSPTLDLVIEVLTAMLCKYVTGASMAVTIEAGVKIAELFQTHVDDLATRTQRPCQVADRTSHWHPCAGCLGGYPCAFFSERKSALMRCDRCFEANKPIGWWLGVVPQHTFKPGTKASSVLSRASLPSSVKARADQKGWRKEHGPTAGYSADQDGVSNTKDLAKVSTDKGSSLVARETPIHSTIGATMAHTGGLNVDAPVAGRQASHRVQNNLKIHLGSEASSPSLGMSLDQQRAEINLAWEELVQYFRIPQSSMWQDIYVKQALDENTARTVNWLGHAVSPFAPSIEAVHHIFFRDGIRRYHAPGNLGITSQSMNMMAGDNAKAVLKALRQCLLARSEGEYTAAMKFILQCSLLRAERTLNAKINSAHYGQQKTPYLEMMKQAWMTGTLPDVRYVPNEALFSPMPTKYYSVNPDPFWRPPRFIEYIEPQIELIAQRYGLPREAWTIKSSATFDQEVPFFFSKSSLILRWTWFDLWEWVCERLNRLKKKCDNHPIEAYADDPDARHRLNPEQFLFTILHLFMALAQKSYRMVAGSTSMPVRVKDAGGFEFLANTRLPLAISVAHKLHGRSMTSGFTETAIEFPTEQGPNAFDHDVCNIVLESWVVNVGRGTSNDVSQLENIVGQFKNLRVEEAEFVPRAPRPYPAGAEVKFDPDAFRRYVALAPRPADRDFTFSKAFTYEFSHVMPTNDQPENLPIIAHEDIDLGDTVPSPSHSKQPILMISEPANISSDGLTAPSDSDEGAIAFEPNDPDQPALEHVNIGRHTTTCYIAAPMQILHKTSLLSTCISSAHLQEVVDLSVRRTDPDLQKHANFLRAVQDIFEQLENGTASGNKVPVKFVRKIREASDSLSPTPGIWPDAYSDANEFFRFMLQKTNIVTDKSMVADRFVNQWKDIDGVPFKVDILESGSTALRDECLRLESLRQSCGHDSQINQRHATHVVIEEVCGNDQCTAVFRTHQFDEMILLQASMSTSSQFQSLRRSWLASDIDQSSGAARTCSSCGTGALCRRRQGIRNSPEILIMAVDRTAHADQQPVLFQERLKGDLRINLNEWRGDLFSEQDNQHIPYVRYELVALLMYINSPPHYAAFVREGPSNDGSWIRYDDRKVTPTYASPFDTRYNEFMETLLVYRKTQPTASFPGAHVTSSDGPDLFETSKSEYMPDPNPQLPHEPALFAVTENNPAEPRQSSQPFNDLTTSDEAAFWQSENQASRKAGFTSLPDESLDRKHRDYISRLSDPTTRASTMKEILSLLDDIERRETALKRIEASHTSRMPQNQVRNSGTLGELQAVLNSIAPEDVPAAVKMLNQFSLDKVVELSKRSSLVSSQLPPPTFEVPQETASISSNTPFPSTSEMSPWTPRARTGEGVSTSVKRTREPRTPSRKDDSPKQVKRYRAGDTIESPTLTRTRSTRSMIPHLQSSVTPRLRPGRSKEFQPRLIEASKAHQITPARTLRATRSVASIQPQSSAQTLRTRPSIQPPQTSVDQVGDDIRIQSSSLPLKHRAKVAFTPRSTVLDEGDMDTLPDSKPRPAVSSNTQAPSQWTNITRINSHRRDMGILQYYVTRQGAGSRWEPAEKIEKEAPNLVHQYQEGRDDF